MELCPEFEVSGEVAAMAEVARKKVSCGAGGGGGDGWSHCWILRSINHHDMKKSAVASKF